MNELTSSWLIERLAAGDLPEAEARALRERLGPALTAELERIAQHNAELLAQHPPAPVAREIERRLAARRRKPAPLWLAMAAAAACAVTLLLTHEPAAPSGEHAAPEQIAERGLRPHLVIYRKTSQGVERLQDRQHVRSGDMLQLAYVAASRKYGVIASIDGRGAVTFHLPEQPAPSDAAARLHERAQSALPHAFQLDDTPGSERFIFVGADEPFPIQVASAALRGESPLDSRFSRSEITLEKTP